MTTEWKFKETPVTSTAIEEYQAAPGRPTYEMEFVCSNCGTISTKFVPKGERASGKGGTCAYCGVTDKGDFTPRIPARLFQSMAMRG